MADLEENQKCWGREYAWSQEGDEWSESWGGPGNQWWGCLYPRIHPFFPTGTILEIAPGFGRWTQFLRELCEHLTVVDLNEKCIEHCKSRFAEYSNIEYHTNDGKSLAMIPDRSVDVIFSYDSLVHADAPVIEAYVNGFAEKLTSDGVGFIHHSNVESYLRPWKWLPEKVLRRVTSRVNQRVNKHWRSSEVSADRFNDYCEAAGLRCISQECVNWGGRYFIDCMFTFTRKGSVWDRPRQLMSNDQFMAEAARLKRLTPALQAPASGRSSSVTT